MPWHDAFDSLQEWLASEAELHAEYRKHMRRKLAGLVVAVAIMGVAITVAFFQLQHEVTLNRQVIATVCLIQTDTIKGQRDSLKESIPLFAKLIPPRDLSQAITRQKGRIAVLQGDLDSLNCGAVSAP